ncbi:uncharacterized protein BHQ10_008933 [Talaromyces amestolkiae]|uniref:Uncharacterized protein n=1 Tax=Talaromyces amestolkiae TaxID=1196081 RepID=A0A364LB32_TALAM|nr:uncharacterized protein BHQ10_008933 [Talaromyces amestolkiae]RAO72921.1 hypothetical protein BHQ10_008933 [Talaromyces amestolkiae]
MADEGISGNVRSTSLLRQAPQDDVVKPEKSTPVIQHTGKLVLAPAHQLPAHLIKLLEEWHQDHPNERPLAAFEKRRSTEEDKVYSMLSRDRKQYPLVEEITITKPMYYSVYYLPIEDGTQVGILVKPLSWGSRICFMKKWLGGNSFRPDPIAVRLMQLQGSFGEFPDDAMWQRATEKKLPNELKSEEEGQATRPSVPRKRPREERESTSSSGGDIYPEVIKPSTRQQQPRARSGHARHSDGALRDIGSDEEVEATPVGLSNGGLPIISRSATVSRFTNAQSHISRNATSRTSLPHTLHGGAALLTSPLFVNAPSATTSDSGVDLPIAANTHLNSSGPALITFKLRIPRTRMERHIRIEDSNEHIAEDLFKEATQYFRRHDRMIGTQILECVVEGEPDCRCIYNAKELRYFIEELRERRGLVKVTVTQSL